MKQDWSRKKRKFPAEESINSDQGFTLVELIVAVALLVILSGALMSAFTNSIQINSRSRARLKATNVAEYIEESVNQYTYEDVKSAMGNVSNATILLSSLLPSSGSSISSASMLGSITTMDQLKASSSSGQCIYTSFNDACGYVLLRNFKYQDMDFDVAISFEDERIGASTDKYFIYTVKVEVYQAHGDTHSFDTPLVTMKGSIDNKQ